MTSLRKHHGVNTRGRDYVVGDIHGQFGVLEALLVAIEFDRDRDRLFSVGDLVDRGPKSRRVTEFLAAPWFHAILGNHEVMLLESAEALARGHDDGAVIDRWRANGGGWFFGLAAHEQQAIVTTIKRLPVTAEIDLPTSGCAGLVHASAPAQWCELTERARGAAELAALDSVTDLVWRRELAYAALDRMSGRTPVDVTIQGIDVVFFGHTPMPVPLRVDNTRWLDTGAGHGKKLSIAQLAVDGRVCSMAVADHSVVEGWAS